MDKLNSRIKGEEGKLSINPDGAEEFLNSQRIAHKNSLISLQNFYAKYDRKRNDLN